jgi:two-component system, NtrC family, sensor kinase
VTPTVVIVDDSLTVRMDLAEAFESAGFAIVLCATAAAARAAFAERPAAVIVLDVVLPDGDGIDLLRELRAAAGGSDAAVLMLSSEAEVRDRVRALQTGADEYVGKPYDRSYVVAKARELLRGRTRGSRADAAASILVIDDSVTFREELSAALVAAGYATHVAATGEEGLRIAGDLRPTALVVDGQLPGIDGPAVIRTVRLDAALRGTPCVLLTADEDARAELRALDAGADAFVRKGEDLEVILARLAAVLRGASDAPDRSTPSLSGPHKILAVDDSLTYLHEVAATLREEGYDVALARSGEEALELLAVQSVDCVLLDLVMPGLGGQETCRRIKSAPIVRDIPLIMLTAIEDRTAMLEGLSAGADDYISKSSELSVLKARVRAQIRRKQFEDENRHIREQLLRKEFEAAEARAARELAETRAAMAEELERKNRELEAFSYSVSHDLRAPLRAIDGFSRAFVEEYGAALEPQGRDYLRRVQESAVRMREMIDDLLALSRVSSGEVRRSRVDVATLARTVVAHLREQDPSRTVELRGPDALVVEADVGLMRTVLENLLGNAWKFTASRAMTVIELGLVEHDGRRVLYVRDNGVGFDPRHAETLFRPFRRLHKAEEYEGTGIGLATVQRIVARHGGRIWAEARPDAGATFYFTLAAS